MALAPEPGQTIYGKFTCPVDPKSMFFRVSDLNKNCRFRLKVFLGTRLLIDFAPDTESLEFAWSSNINGTLSPGIFYLTLTNVSPSSVVSRGFNQSLSWKDATGNLILQGALNESTAEISSDLAGNTDPPFPASWEDLFEPVGEDQSIIGSTKGPLPGDKAYYQIRLTEFVDAFDIKYKETGTAPFESLVNARIYRGPTRIWSEPGSVDATIHLGPSEPGIYYIILENRGLGLQGFEITWIARHEQNGIALASNPEQATLTNSAEFASAASESGFEIDNDEVAVNSGNMMRRGLRDWQNGQGIRTGLTPSGQARVMITDADKQKLWFTSTDNKKATVLLSGKGGYISIRETPGEIYAESSQDGSVLIDSGVTAKSTGNDEMTVRGGVALLRAGGGGKVKCIGPLVFIN